MKDEKFLKVWEKERRKGKIKYMLIMSKITFIFWMVAFIIFTLIKGKFIKDKCFDFFFAFLGAFIGVLIGSYSKWDHNEKKYNDLINKK